MTSSAGFDPQDLVDDVVVVLLAAGSGERLGSKRPKAFVGLGGKVLLAHPLQAFEEHEAVDSIVLVVPEGWVEPTEVLVDDLGCDRVTSIEVGGSSRAASVLAGLHGVPNRRQTAVLVHDSARPVVPASLVDRVLAPLAEGWDAVVPALPVTDTIKHVDPATGRVRDTPERGTLRAAQTPQCCRASALHAALEGRSDEQLASITDCGQAVELAGGRVLCVEGDARVGKVTTAADLQAIAATFGGPLVPAADADDHDEPLDEDDLAGFTGPAGD